MINVSHLGPAGLMVGPGPLPLSTCMCQDEPCTMEDYADDAAALLEAVFPDRPAPRSDGALKRQRSQISPKALLLGFPDHPCAE